MLVIALLGLAWPRAWVTRQLPDSRRDKCPVGMSLNKTRSGEHDVPPFEQTGLDGREYAIAQPRHGCWPHTNRPGRADAWWGLPFTEINVQVYAIHWQKA